MPNSAQTVSIELDETVEPDTWHAYDSAGRYLGAGTSYGNSLIPTPDPIARFVCGKNVYERSQRAKALRESCDLTM
jgi:hypothetical protein